MSIKIEKIKLFIGYIIIAFIIFSTVFIILYLDKNYFSKLPKHADFIRENKLYYVREVLDGDTFIVDVENKSFTIRLLGIDTPETVDPRKSVQCYGIEASNKAKSFLYHKYVYLERDNDKSVLFGDYDKYGRVLAYVSLSNGLFYNKYMIENGFAREYTFNREKYKYQKEFKKAESIAKKNKLGLWGKCMQ